MNSGKSSVEAYAELCFDSDVFGVNRVDVNLDRYHF